VLREEEIFLGGKVCSTIKKRKKSQSAEEMGKFLIETIGVD
jgi:hypothetical protein